MHCVIKYFVYLVNYINLVNCHLVNMGKLMLVN